MPPTPGPAPEFVVPNTSDFQLLLNSLTFERPSGAGSVDEVLGAPASPANDSSGDYTDVPLFAVPQGGANLPWLVAAVRRELRRLGHLDTPQLANLLLSMFVLHRNRTRDPVAVLTQFLRTAVECSLSQYVVVAADAPSEFELTLKPFWLGPLNAEQLRYQVERAGCDFFRIYGESLRGRLVIQREPRRILAVPAQSLHEFKFGPYEEERVRLMYSLVDRYFGELGRTFIEEFWNELRDVQWLTAATGAPYLDGRVFRERLLGTTIVNVFLKFPSGMGWVAPQGLGLSFELGPSKRIPAHACALEEAYGPSLHADSEFVNVCRVVSRLIVRALEHKTDRRIDEAFLSHVIVLDLVFGEKGRSTESVTERVAVLLGPEQGNTAAKRKKHVAELYDKRSRYVHQGKSCDRSDLEAVTLITQQVVHALMRVASLPTDVRPATVAHWLLKLDGIWAAELGGLSIAEADLVSAGLKR